MGEYKEGDIVVRQKYGGDIMFRIVTISNNTDGTKLALLKGLFLRLLADAPLGDLQMVSQHDVSTQQIRAEVINQDHVSQILRRRSKKDKAGWRSETGEKREAPAFL